MDGFNMDLNTQIKILEKVIRSNDVLNNILVKAMDLGLSDYYVGAGCVAQTIWNNRMKFDLNNGISDIDFVYFDRSDLSINAENLMIEHIKKKLNFSPIKLDIKNQARVHLWYKEHFGYDIRPYKSIEDAINTWPTTATSIGIRLENNNLKVYAPLGLNDLFGMIVRANKIQITEEIYIKKVNKWKINWPTLTIIPW